ncbi:PREDICTED: 28S ribosomal protein S5, mitochondrial [Eufriesea mexicana]|uniref:28S ribosomal protein S5, mitochondrial n=1 Tax=Eufriesea mexicana TaxID=516756 RepID=UPI00083C7E5C|nr:PREDICTED: 28S ribosomal protein S5, mitochondrial [Eufriesea mexicana]
MAGRMFCTYKLATNYIKNINIKNNALRLLTPQILLSQNVRNSTFFTKKTGEQLWKSVNSISNAGRRRGRGKGKQSMPPKDVNASQQQVYGKVPVIFPGLNSPILRGKTLIEQRVLTSEEGTGIQPSIMSNIKRKRVKTHPLDRGWSGGHPHGRKCGAPAPINCDEFNGFESWIIQNKYVTIMSSTLGRVKRHRTFVITGNRNGLAGFASVTKHDLKGSISAAKNKAGQRLIYIERYNDHTVLHDFFAHFGKTKIFVTQKPKGYGLKCHRAIRTCCEAIGITDLHAKIEGSKNVIYIVKAFFIGLLQQKTYQEMANEKGLHLVEMRKENNYFPKVLASPARVRDSTEISSSEILDFKQYVMNGRVPLKRKPNTPFYAKLPTWLVHLRKQERLRNHDNVVIKLRSEYDDVCSFLAEKYPEAKASKWRKRDNKEKEST